MSVSDLKSHPADRPVFPSRVAYPCFREIVNDQGHGFVWFVMLPDGHLLDCGTKWGEERAKILCRLINEAGHEQIDKEALEAFR